MKEHNLKCKSVYFQAQIMGLKNFEIRLNDLDFQVGDRLNLWEINDSNEETGETATVTVTYMLNGPAYGLAEGWCILSTKLGKRRLNSSTGQRPDSEKVAVDYGISIGMPESMAIHCLTYYTKTGWKMASGTPIRDWKAAFREWSIRGKKVQTGTETDVSINLVPRIVRRAATLSDHRSLAVFGDPAIGAIVSHYGWESLKQDKTYLSFELGNMMKIYQRAKESPHLGTREICCNPNGVGIINVPTVEQYDIILREKNKNNQEQGRTDVSKKA